MEQIKNLSGKHFGYLTALYPTNRRIQRKVVWKCLCVCGKECEVLSTNLTSGRTISCGCMKGAIISSMRRSTNPKIGDIVNGTKVLEVTHIPDSRGYNECWLFVECKICGRNYWVKATLLQRGTTKTCGCAKLSYGETVIGQILDEHHVPYEREKTFVDCYCSDIHNKCRFDFYINETYLLEFDGLQHYMTTNGSTWFTEEVVETIRKRDKYKNEWCKNKNIPLIRIPYYHLENLVLDDLLLDRTKFLVTQD